MILVLGATGFLGSHVCKKLDKMKLDFTSSSLSLGVDLRNEQETEKLFGLVRPDVVINCASYVGGLQFGLSNPTQLFTDNLKMCLNIYSSLEKFHVKKIINPISNCTYPGKSSLFKVDEWWDGPLHDSVLIYGYTKKALWIASRAYSSQTNLITNHIILPNMYGPGDHLDEYRSHALGAIVSKFVIAKRDELKKVVIWGTGAPVREWLHIEDGAEALIRSLELDLGIAPINVGRAQGHTVKELAYMIKDAVNVDCDVVFDVTKEDGAPIKTIDGSTGKNALAWEPEIELSNGLKETVSWYSQVLSLDGES